MLTMIARGQVQAFEREWGYDTTYLQDILDAGGFTALMPYANAQKMGQFRKDVPGGPYFAAKLTSIRIGDCGPCVQLVANMAERAGVESTHLRAILERNFEALPEDMRLGAEFAEATLNHDLPRGDELRARVVARWGKLGLVSLAYAIANAQIYPALKFALGYGHICQRVRVGNETVAVPALA